MSSARLHVVQNPIHRSPAPGRRAESGRGVGEAGPAGPERPGASATEFSETVRNVVSLARKGGLEVPVFRSPPRHPGVDRTIRWRNGRPPVVAIARGERPLAAVQADAIEAIVVVNRLDERRAGRFRHAAWAALHPAGSPSVSGADSADRPAPVALGRHDTAPGEATSDAPPVASALGADQVA
ncbi:MAG: hypothetical protein KDB31_14260 [Microthrixaceae bacterium]|nr:hypothetical protein [Microthrixaceae bacterium]